MTIESYLERIATALEKIAAAKPVVADAAPVPAAPKPRGRPPGSVKATIPVADLPGEPVIPVRDPEQVAEVDPFATEEETPAAPPATKADVRAALVAYQARSTPAKAQALLKTVGGVETLASLAEDKFALVIKAAQTAK